MTLYHDTPRRRFAARVGSRLLGTLCAELLAIARSGVRRLAGSDAALAAEELALLDPLDRIVAEGRTVADRLVDLHRQTGGDPGRLIPLLRLAV